MEKKLLEVDLDGSDSIQVKHNLFEIAFKNTLVEVGSRKHKGTTDDKLNKETQKFILVRAELSREPAKNRLTR